MNPVEQAQQVGTMPQGSYAWTDEDGTSLELLAVEDEVHLSIVTEHLVRTVKLPAERFERLLAEFARNKG